MFDDVPEDAERALLAAFFLDGASVLDICGEEFSTDIFGLPQHRHLARAILSVVEDKSAIDPVTVNAALQRLGLLDAIGDAFSFRISAAYGTSGNVEHYLRVVVESARIRAAKAIGRSLAESGDADAARLAIDKLITGERAQAKHLAKIEMRLLERFDQERKDLESGIVTLLPTGFQKLDEYIGGWRAGVLYVFAARPGSGKSALAAAFAENLGKRKFPSCAFWLEDDEEDFARRMIQRGGYVPSVVMRHGSFASAEHWDRFNNAVSRHAEMPIYLDDTHGLTATEIAGRMRRYRRELGIRVFIVDHLGEVSLDSESAWEKHHLALGRAARIYRDTGKEIGAATILFAQMNREVEKRDGGRAKLTDIEGSDQVGQAARFIGFVKIPERDAAEDPGQEKQPIQGNEMIIDIAKNTHGPRGAVTLRWRKETMSVEEP